MLGAKHVPINNIPDPIDELDTIVSKKAYVGLLARPDIDTTGMALINIDTLKQMKKVLESDTVVNVIDWKNLKAQSQQQRGQEQSWEGKKEQEKEQKNDETKKNTTNTGQDEKVPKTFP
jgi:hypothetical protein